MNMSKIINFPVKKQNSNGYYNLVALFKICDNVESCNFYLDANERIENVVKQYVSVVRPGVVLVENKNVGLVELYL
jgi:hypothetical protein